MVTHYEVGLVCLSVAVAILASYAALDLTRRSSDANGWRRRLWIMAGGGTMGAGIWSMHFIGMLALRMSMPVSYNDWLVALSMLAAIVGATVSLTVVTRPHISRAGVLSAGTFMGLAVTAMHYLGMASMEMSATTHWRIALVLASVAIGIVASLIALWLLVRIRVSADGFGFVRRTGAAVLLGVGVAGLHYTAMAACTFTPIIGRVAPHHGLSTNALVVLLGVGAGVMLAVLIGGSALDQRRASLASDLTIVASIARELCRVGDTRRRICEAIGGLTAADYVLLAESGEAADRTITASAGLDLDSTGGSHRAAGAVVGDLCGTGEITGGLHRLADGTAVLYEPLVLDGQTVGMLAAGWRGGARRLPDRTMTLVSMVAAEGAVALDRESLLTKLEDLARRDGLTGLLNRRVLGEELDRELAAAHRHDRPLSVVMLDLDNFKSYNDTCGHQAGDRLLKGAAAAWGTQLRNTDLIARYGGEEFAVILPGCGIEDAILTARRLREAVPDGATCSAGVAILEGTESATQLIGRADRALYHAKASGRNCTAAAHLSTAVEVVRPDSPLPASAADRLTSEPDRR